VKLDEILRQIQGPHYASVMLDDTSDIQMVAQLTTALRYIRDGKTPERSVGSSDVRADRSYDSLFSHLQNVVSKFNLESKLVAQMCNCASVMSEHLNGFSIK
jgi:hypothetical protein